MESIYHSSPGLPRSAPPGFESKMDTILRQYEATKEAEQRRHQFLEKLMEHIQTISHQRDEAIRKLQRTERLNNAYQDDLNIANAKIDALQKSMDCDRFVLAVIDGDNALFEDEYVKAGAAGGERAAQRLHQCVLGYLRNKPYFQLDFKLVIKIFINLQGLLRTYLDTMTIPNQGVLLSFVQGFNKTHDLAEIIDAGNLKEASDSKVKALLSLNRRNIHCKHILLAASGDNSYAGFLRQFIAGDGASQQVTLIESIPFARDLAHLTSHFQTTKFDGVFRTTKIDKFTSTGMARVPVPEAPGNAAVAWVKADAQPAMLPFRSAMSPEAPGSTLAKTGIPVPKPHKEILVNVYNERLDSYIKHDYKIYTELKNRKMCNYYWLLDACDGSYCTHDHSGRLTPAEIEQLRLVARTLCCRAGLDCKDPDCIDGHRCQGGERCPHGDRCRFPKAMHTVSMEGRRTVPVEWKEDDENGAWLIQVK